MAKEGLDQLGPQGWTSLLEKTLGDVGGGRVEARRVSEGGGEGDRKGRKAARRCRDTHNQNTIFGLGHFRSWKRVREVWVEKGKEEGIGWKAGSRDRSEDSGSSVSSQAQP